MNRQAAHYQTLSRRDLSPRQREVLELIAKGRTNGEIAERLGISLDGAKWHVSEILTKLGVSSREEAAEWCHSRRGIGDRFANLARAFGPLAQWKFATPVAAIAVAGTVFAAAFAFGGDDSPDDDTLPACTVDDIILEPVEATSPPGQPVGLAVTARSRGADCRFEGSVGVSMEADGRAAGSMLVDVDLDVKERREAIAYLSWTDSCRLRGDKVTVSATLVREGQQEPLIQAGPLFVVGRPVCRSGPAPLSSPIIGGLPYSLVAVPPGSAAFDIGPDPLEAVYCFPSDPDEYARWLAPCEAVDRIQQGLLAKNVEPALSIVALREYTCPESGTGGIGGPSFLCEGAAPGEVRQGIPVVFHGSAGDVYSVDQFGAALESMIESSSDGPLFATRISTVACLAQDCGSFVLGIANDGTPPTAYFVFEPREGTLRITAVGFAGENALILRRGGEMRVAGSAELVSFVPIVGPY